MAFLFGQLVRLSRRTLDRQQISSTEGRKDSKAPKQTRIANEPVFSSASFAIFCKRAHEEKVGGLQQQQHAP